MQEERRSLHQSPLSVEVVKQCALLPWLLLLQACFVSRSCHSFGNSSSQWSNPSSSFSVSSQDKQDGHLGKAAKVMELWFAQEIFKTDIHQKNACLSEWHDENEQDDGPDTVLVVVNDESDDDDIFPIRIRMNKDRMSWPRWMMQHKHRLYSCHEQKEVDDNSDESLLVQLKPNRIMGIVVNLDDSNDGQEQAMAAMGSVDWILVTTTTTTTSNKDESTSSSSSSSSSWQMIPAENLIGAAVSSGTKIAFVVKQASDVGGLARALELGVDALCVIRNGKDNIDAQL